MAKWTLRGKWAGAALIVSFALTGCGGKPPVSTASTEAEKSDAAVGSLKSASAGETAANTRVDQKLDPRLHESFTEATLSEPPASAQRPVDLTIGGKSTGKLYTEVVKSWDTIKFSTPAGKRIDYRAVLETDQGTIVIELLPEFAPNHVRSFVALARAGLYEGLLFQRTVRESVPDQTEKLELIEGGCPVGTGELGQGSIGYWLKSEINPQITHVEGTVGASHAADDDADACKFYINLCKAPFMDDSFTVFGKVSQGLDVAKKILNEPVRKDADQPSGDRPVKPVVIRKVTIETGEIL